MSNESLALASAHDVKTNRTLASTYSRNITLTNIGLWSWFFCDFAIAFVFASIAFSLTPYSVEIQQGLVKGDHVGRLMFCFGTGLLIALVGLILGLHETKQWDSSLKFLGRCAVVSSVALLVLNLELMLVHYLIVSRFVTFYTVIGCAIGLFTVRALVVDLFVRNRYVVGFVGSEKFTRTVLESADLNSAHGLASSILTMREDENIDLLNWALVNRVNQIVVDPTDPICPSQLELLGLMNVSFNVSTYSNFVEKLSQRIPSEYISAQWVIECQEGHAVLYKTAVKRALDIFIASIGIILLFPCGLLAAISVKMGNSGSIIYRQTRVGQFGQPFTMLKFRTMVKNAEQRGPQLAVESDNRITAVGKFLRRTRIDEIPQLLNVLAGEMSIVGPRPERPELTPELESRIPFFESRVLVKPGITGWAQVNAGYAATDAESATKLSFDLYYVKNLSLSLDLRVLLRTISSFASGSR